MTPINKLTHCKSTKTLLHKQSMAVIEGLIKLAWYPEHGDAPLWKETVTTEMSRMPVVDGKPYLMSASAILNNTWYKWEAELSKISSEIVEEYGCPKSCKIPTDVYESIYNYFFWISKSLSTLGIVCQCYAIALLHKFGF